MCDAHCNCLEAGNQERDGEPATPDAQLATAPGARRLVVSGAEAATADAGMATVYLIYLSGL
jgi:hypothetical protein